ncbi:hypothetical protein U9M48_028258 [Paspalum notatum var. saurae]|uniref:Uncharacterized protein n=1 Tax=Paspalum notatum var. saurae TaxID=547442 RepID=A0AAQ3U0X8_PASNO
MLAVDDPLRATPAPPLHLHRVPLALAQLWIPIEVPPTSFLARIGSPRRRHTDAAAPRFTAAAPPLRSSPRAEIWGKSFPVDGNTVRHRLGSKSGDRPPAQPTVPSPAFGQRRKRRKSKFNALFTESTYTCVQVPGSYDTWSRTRCVELLQATVVRKNN